MTRGALMAALLVGAVAACAQPAAAAGCAAHEASFPALIGRSEADVRTALAAMPGIRAVRVGGPDTMMTQDFREDRATVLVVDGAVRRITCG
ncbi:peptidase inhibitor I78 [Roseomonas terrae]|uniref:Peptidase inhibitor I78 n=1 Tax=Neoroseomonas terrae TaxID=424799 RepID=A0ABS5EK53_9PROT|nr:hypothetical protein [Neoroseomonas terrae]MBR0651389.1 peptidase inhibitor I78 [Neoroseomonas terrae]